MKVLPFTQQFDATDMTYEQMKQHARDLGWHGVRMIARDIIKTDRVIVRRMSKRDCDER